MSLKDLEAKIKGDAAFADLFKGLKTVDEIVAKAKENGFNLSKEDIEQLSDVSASELSKAAGGGTVITTNWFVKD